MAWEQLRVCLQSQIFINLLITPDGGKASGHCAPLYLVSPDFAPVKKLKKKHLCYFRLKNKCFDGLPVISFG